MRDLLINIINYRLKMGVSKEDIFKGMVFTICKTLDIPLVEARFMINDIILEKHVDNQITHSLENIKEAQTINLFKLPSLKENIRSKVKEISTIIPQTGT